MEKKWSAWDMNVQRNTHAHIYKRFTKLEGILGRINVKDLFNSQISSLLMTKILIRIYILSEYLISNLILTKYTFT